MLKINKINVTCGCFIKPQELLHILCHKEIISEELNKEEMSEKLVPNFQLAPLF
jgi:hypothetical protein